MSARRTRSYNAKKRPVCIEALESRQLFAASVMDPSYVVRTDEPAPVRLDVLRQDQFWPVTLDLARFDSTTSTTGELFNSGQTLVSSTLVIITPPQHGTATVGADGKSILYLPAKGYSGKDLVQYAIEDNFRLGPRQIQQLNVLVVDQSWVAVPDWTSVKSGATVSLDLLRNDRLNANFVGANDWSLTLKSAVSTSGAQIKISNDGKSIEYVSNADFTGVDVVTYTAKDQDGYTVEGKAEIRVFAATDSNRSWPEQVRHLAIESAVNANATNFGRFNSWYQNYVPYLTTITDLSFSTNSTSLLSADNRSTLDSFTGTNTQFANVDESDWTKTDGEFLYIISQNNYWKDTLFSTIDTIYFRDPVSTLTVVDVRKPSEPRVIASRQLSGYPVSLDLHEDRLTVFYSGSNTTVDVFDVSSPGQLSLVSSSEFGGSFKFARRVDDRLVVFTNSYQGQALKYNPYDDTVASTEANRVATMYEPWGYWGAGSLSIAELGTEFLSRISEDLDGILPGYTIHGSTGELLKSGNFIEFEQNYLGRHVTDFSYLTNIITLNTGANDGGLIDWDVAQGTSQVLVTNDSIYVAGYAWESNGTTVEKFDFNSDEVQFAASGKVDGTLRVDFSMDEFEGNLRILTLDFGTPARVSDLILPGPSTSLFVLAETDNEELSVIGSLKGLAPGETVFSVRFAEQTAYVVTAIVVDPLFVIDLSDPTKPVLKGELKVPGVSTYLELIDYLLSVGRGTLGWGSTAVSLFDISDPTSPKLVDREVIENSWMEMNYQAIQYLDAFNTLAIPLNGSGNDGTWTSRIMTFAIDVDKGIELTETIGFDSPASRSLQIGDYLYALSNRQIKVISLTDPSFEVVTIDYFESDTQVPQPPTSDPGTATEPSETIATLLPTVKVSATAGLPITVDLPFQVSSTLPAKIKSAVIESGIGEVEIVNDGTQIKFTPDRRSRGPQLVKYIVDTDSGDREASLEVEPSAWQWHNDQDQLDCNDDGRITPSDALLTINVLDRYGSISTESLDRMYGDGSVNDVYYFDSNSDGHVSPVDALLVINRLNENSEARTLEKASQSALVGSGEAAQFTFYDVPDVDKKRRS